MGIMVIYIQTHTVHTQSPKSATALPAQTTDNRLVNMLVNVGKATDVLPPVREVKTGFRTQPGFEVNGRWF